MKIIEILNEYESRYGEDRTMKNPMPHITGDDRIFGHIFDLSDDVIYGYAEKLDIEPPSEKFKAAAKMASTLQSVPVSAIIGTEKYVDPRGVKTPRSNNPIEFIKYEGKYYIMDGNHRAVHAFVNGEKQVQGNVIEVED